MEQEHEKATSLSVIQPDNDKLMAKADELFYSGKITEAAPLYEKVLELNPNRMRARDRIKDIKAGHLPESAIPPEAGVCYGRALSLCRRGNFKEAIIQLQIVVKELNGIYWAEAYELISRSYAGLQAQEAYEEGLKAELNGDWNAAKTFYESAKANSIEPRYTEALYNIQRIIEKAAIVQAALVRPAHNLEEAKKLIDAKAVAEELLLINPENPMIRRLWDELNKMLPESALLVAMDLANQGEVKEAKELLQPYAHSKEAKETLKEITKKYRDELRVAVELRTKELGDLRRQRAIWFSFSVIASVFVGAILLIASLSALKGNLSAGIISILSSILPGAFVKLFLNQYRELNTQLYNHLKKSPEIEKFERLAILSGAGIDEDKGI
jgi:tetratricopeptide (TPR) repeat protein